MPSTYETSTYKASALWQSSTKVKYNPNPKHGKSFDRYAKYEKARTIDESLQLGSKPEDLLFDYEKGHLNILGPLRKAPIDPLKLKPKDCEKLTDADRILIRYGCKKNPSMVKAIMSLTNESRTKLRKMMLAKSLGLASTEELESRISGVAFQKRTMAELEAKAILEEADKAKRNISEFEVTRVLDRWGFAQNPNRINVMRKGVKWVYSDTIGAIARRDGKILPQSTTPMYPNFVKVVTRYLHDHLPEELKSKFVFTSVNINKNYAGARHRDGGNSGPSILTALGNFTGGKLRYFPSDDKTKKIEQLSPGDSQVLDAKNGLIFFDGNRAHEVENFKGARYSLVYFSCARFWKMPPAEQKTLKKLGVTYPSPATIGTLKGTLEAPSRCGGKLSLGGSLRRSAAMKVAARVKGNRAKFPGFGYFPLTEKQKANETKAQKIYKNKPLVKPPVEMRVGGKRKIDGTWSVDNAFALGAKLNAKLKPLEFKGANNLVDAVDILNKDPKQVPKAIAKAGYCAIYTIRTKCYYVVFLHDKEVTAIKASGMGSSKLLDLKASGKHRVSAAKLSHAGA